MEHHFASEWQLHASLGQHGLGLGWYFRLAAGEDNIVIMVCLRNIFIFFMVCYYGLSA